MQWNDKKLPYSGKNKSIIYNYIHFVYQTLRKKFPNKDLPNVYIINYILDNRNWDNSIFGEEAKIWFRNELKTNPHLLSFIDSEITKIKEMPNVYSYKADITRDNSEEKSNIFSKIIQNYIVSNPQLPHFYFSSIDNDEVKRETEIFVKTNFRRYRCRRNVLETRYEKMLKIKKLLERDLGIKTEFYDIGMSTLGLKSQNDNFVVNIFRWGDFPLVEKNPSKTQLFCIADEISVFVFGFASPENITKYSNDRFLFMKEKPEALNKMTSFYGFNKEVFSLDLRKR